MDSDSIPEVTEQYARRTVTMPLFPLMTEEQAQLVVAAAERAGGR
jgi:dTDP-4-amino-4,6-dideoxygalactose transaminase